MEAVVKLGSSFHMEFPDLVEIKITKRRGIFRPKFLIERYVNNKLIAKTWIGLNDTVKITIKLDGWTE